MLFQYIAKCACPGEVQKGYSQNNGVCESSGIPPTLAILCRQQQLRNGTEQNKSWVHAQYLKKKEEEEEESTEV